jgi:hypothetical protein
MNAVAMVDPSCPTTVDGSKVSVTGDLTYRADMTYTANTTVSGTLSFTLPVACLTALPCSQLGVMSTAGSGRCVVAGSDCTCTFTYPAQVSSEAGTYTTTAAGLLTETPTNGTARATDYCIKGTTLTESPRDDTTMMGPSISGTVTFARQ